jgi:hypothetical protein
MAWFGKKEEKKTPPASIPLGKGNPGKFEGPLNPLEQALISLRQREIAAPKFLEYLFNSEVYIAVPEEKLQGSVRGGQLSGTPTLFTITYPTFVCLCFYTHVSRLKPTHDQYPAFRYAVSARAGDILLGIQGNFGLIINPYWDINLEWNAEQVGAIKKMLVKN